MKCAREVPDNWLETLKKRIVQEKWKHHLLRRSAAQARAAKRFKGYRREKNFGHSRRARPRHDHFKKTSTLTAPQHFSLIENPSEVIQFLNRMRILGRRQNIFVDMASITTLTTDGIAAFLAAIHHRDLANANIFGNVPRDVRLRQRLTESGFYEYVSGKSAGLHRVAMGAIRKRQHSGETFREEFNQFVASDLIAFATERLRGAPGPHQPSYSVLGEAMLNTVYHASASPDEREPWWASVFVDTERRRACFTFIDQGVGIFKSHRLGLRLNLATHLRFTDRAEILRDLMHGKIPSSTKVPGRGNGIPGMYGHCKARRIRSLTVLANDAIGYAETEVYSVLNTSFDGTVLYWEIDA